ncbi:MAG TPA: hypothetical protein VK488_07480 [Gaiellaceae bacterium]|nr:hypothetical protein [Gaiellaceae bacterium]
MKKKWRWPLAGFVLGGLVGATLLTVNVVGASSPVPAGAESNSFGEILHTPPLLARASEPIELRYDVVCGGAKDEPGGTCSPKGSVFVRASGANGFVEQPLEREPDGLLSAEVSVGDGGFDYYAEIENGHGETATLPEAAAAAPQHVWPLRSWTTVDLGAESFGETTPPSSVVSELTWGKGTQALGLDSGQEQSRIGPSAFDVAPDGSIVVLDQVNHRLSRLRPDGTSMQLPIDFAGGEGDLAVGGDGTIYVLDAGASQPVVRSFSPAGDLIAGTPLGEATGDMIRVGSDGPLVHAYPSEMWLPTGRGRPPLAPEQQLSGAQAARTVDGGQAVVVSASPAEARFALVRGGDVVGSWLVRSSTSLGEVQLAEPYGDGLLVVVRVWDENQAVFRVLRLAPDGLAGSFAVDRAEWAETASLSRFRLHGSTLYQLRSDPSGVEIAAFEIGGTR